MLFNNYIEESAKTAIYPTYTTKQVDYAYLVLGLIGEIYEVCDLFRHRGDADKIVDELGDVMWYAAALIRVFKLDSVAVITPALRAAYYYPSHTNYQTIIDMMQYAAVSLADPAKKTLRNQDYEMDRALVEEAVSNVIAGVIALANRYDSNFERVMDLNMEKLKHRQEQNTLAGDGHGRDE
jgi:NTP pyrophosphatase (non-canonical NTP hydrolase)